MNRTPTLATSRSTTGTLSLFGHASTEANVVILVRSRKWRLGRTLVVATVTLIVAPVVALIPPHAPWAVAALGIGAMISRRRWLERQTVLNLSGHCPNCGEPLSVERPTRLRHPHALDCDTCHYEPLLKLNLNETRKSETTSPLTN